MSNPIQIFIGSNNLDLPGFYPDDLPSEWHFDYYSSNIRALSLPYDTDEDLEEILENIDDNFKLVIDITSADNLVQFLQTFKKYKDNFILFSKNINVKSLKLITDYKFCIQTDKKLKNCKNIKILTKNLCFNDFAVVFTERLSDEKQIKITIEELAKSKKDIILLQNNVDEDTLTKTRIISELLGYS